VHPSKIAILVLAGAALLACRKEDSRPVKEAVAQAKSAATEASDSTQAAAADAKQAASEAASEVRASVEKAEEKADRAVTGATQAVQTGVSSAAESTRAGADRLARGVRELGEGGVVVGEVSSFSTSRLKLRPEKAGPAELRLDAHTRYLFEGGQLRAGGLAAGTRVKAVYVVEAGEPVATEVEVVHR
jgi:hypothetical protein